MALNTVVPWIVEYAAHLLNRFEVGHDGKTAYERSKGKTAKSMGIELGEAVLWKRKPAGGALGKLTVLWNEGVYLGREGADGRVRDRRRPRHLEDADDTENTAEHPMGPEERGVGQRRAVEYERR